MVWTALGEVLPQATAIAISPVPIVLVILVLLSPRSKLSGLAFAVGWSTGLFVLTAAAYWVADAAGSGTDPSAADGANVLQLLIGLLFAVFAVQQWRKRPRPGVEPSPPKLAGAIAAMRPPKLLGVGFASAAANPKNMPLCISAGVAVAQLTSESTEGIWAVILFSLVASTSVLVAVAVTAALGDRVRRPLEEIASWLMANRATIMFVVFALLAAKLVGSGLALAS